MAVNYMEDGTRKEPALINAFHKSPGCIIGNGDTMVLPDIPSTIFEGEAELALIIGKGGSFISASKAMDHIFGYVNFIDGSARGVKPENNSFYQMKSRATFAPIGPYIVTADEVKDPQNLQVKLWVNGISNKTLIPMTWLTRYRAVLSGFPVFTPLNLVTSSRLELTTEAFPLFKTEIKWN